MAHAFDPALPFERPLKESLAIYAKRLAILLAVALANAVLLAILWLNTRSPVFSALAVSIFVIAVVSAFFFRTSERRLLSVYLVVSFEYLQILMRYGREKFMANR